MLLLKKYSRNNLVVTVSQNKTIANPYYLFSFTHIMSKTTYRFYPKNVSTHTERYDEFQFDENDVTNLNLNIPSVNFEYDGQYYYSIYEMSSSATTNPSNAVSKLEEGRALMIDNFVPEQYEEFISSNENNSNWIFISSSEEPSVSFFILLENSNILTSESDDGIEYER